MIGEWGNAKIWVGLAVIVALFVPTIMLVPRQPFFEAADAACFAAAVALCFGSAKTTWVAIKLPIRPVGLGHLLSVGFFIICLAIAMVFGFLWGWRALGKPDWLTDWIPAAFSRWLLAAGLFTAVSVNFTSGGAVTINSYRRSLTLLGGAVALAAALILVGLG